MSATATARAARLPIWVAGLAPLVLLALLVAAFLVFNPIAGLREAPPVESIAVERTTLEEGRVELRLRNDGPDPVTIAQVLVNDAYWEHAITDRTLERLETATLAIDYPWDEGLPLDIALVTSTGVVIDHGVEAAALTPEMDAATLGVYALLGLYIGVIPVAIGLFWFSALRRASKRWLGFFLAFTVGLLVFLLVDTVEEGIELAGETAATLNGLGLFALGALAAVAGLLFVEEWLGRRRSEGGAPGATLTGLALAYLVAVGIGLHNLGVGLAVGAALAAGEVALGTFLVLGFALHNTTEGLAIVAPVGSTPERPRPMHFVVLGLIAGAPAILGAWAGGFAFSPAWAALAFGVAAGAIAQVVWTISRSGRSSLFAGWGALGFVAGLLFMYITGLFTA
ncbi:MAG TPA: ZIP family metal transporter [Actinomycetota bacterium]|nr:ZIP family metal transporter [Actinomycetota bacterium]